MKKTLVLLVCMVVVNTTITLGQNSIKDIAVDLNKTDTFFDFWLGTWKVTWDEGNDKIGIGTNEIIKILDGKVIRENFQVTGGGNSGFKGTSISVYQPNFNRWKQAWADNQGGYFDFVGEIDGDKRILKTQPATINGKNVISRMVFKNIKKDSFTWDWQRSYDDGKTWEQLWRIDYKRTWQ